MMEIDVNKCEHIWINNNKECLAYQDCCDNRPDCYYKQLQQLKAENEAYKNSIIANLDLKITKRFEELLEENEELKNQIKLIEKNTDSYSDCLDEIEEYCKEEGWQNHSKHFVETGYILQKIKEVKGNE